MHSRRAGVTASAARISRSVQRPVNQVASAKGRGPVEQLALDPVVGRLASAALFRVIARGSHFVAKKAVVFTTASGEDEHRGDQKDDRPQCNGRQCCRIDTLHGAANALAPIRLH